MEKRWLILMEIVCLIVFFNIAVSAEIINIQTENTYLPGEEVEFKIFLYDDNNNEIEGIIDYEIQNYYTDVVSEGSLKSGELSRYKLPENAIRGYWAVIAKYEELEKKELFNVMELEKAEILLDGDKLVITNVGNVPYSKTLQISIGNHDETALVPLDIGETKEIKLTAPNGVYNVRVSDGTEKNIEFNGVSLTGNVIGLENLRNDNFLLKNSVFSLFIFIILVTLFVIYFSRLGSRKKLKPKVKKNK